MHLVYIGPGLRFAPGKTVLHRAQDGQLPDVLTLAQVAALLAATLDDPTGEVGRSSSYTLLRGIVADGLPVDKANAWSIRREDLARFAGTVQARCGALPPGFVAWAGSLAEVTTTLVQVTTKRLCFLLKKPCPTIATLVRERSRTPWLERCSAYDPTAGNMALLWAYWSVVEELRNRGKIFGDVPDPSETKASPDLEIVASRWMAQR